MNYGKEEKGYSHYGFTVPGANCEYNVYSTKALRKIPDNLSFEHASLLDTAGVALHGIEMIGVTPGGTVAVWGPGPIGLCAMQMMKGMGAKTVIMVGRKHRLKVAGEIGADILIDFEKEDPVKRVLEITGGKGVDGKVYPLQKGSIAVFPQRSIHMLRNTGPSELKVICFFAPPTDTTEYTFHESIKFPGVSGS